MNRCLLSSSRLAVDLVVAKVVAAVIVAAVVRRSGGTEEIGCCCGRLAGESYCEAKEQRTDLGPWTVGTALGVAAGRWKEMKQIEGLLFKREKMGGG